MTRSLAGRSLLAAVVLAGLLPEPGARADDPVGSNVRYTREIVRILERKCLPCHESGSIAERLDSYREVRAWGRAIREEIVEQRMPPWSAAPGYGRFEKDLALSAREEATLLSWLDGGMRRGEDADLPPPPAAPSQQPPDLRLEVPPQQVPPGEELVVRRVRLDSGLARERWLGRLVLRPGARRVLRGALVFASAPGPAAGGEQWIGAWTPWRPELAPPEPHAFRLPAGAALTLLLYYRGDTAAVVDRSRVELHFAPAPAAGAVEDVRLEAATRDLGCGGAPRSTGERALVRAATLWALQPAAGESARSLELRARRPDGSVEVLLWMPRYRPEWPQALVLQDPMPLPAGTRLSLAVCHEPGEPGADAVTPQVALSVLR